MIRNSSLTNADFASAIGIDPTKLSKSLGGLRRFTSFELASVASRGRTTVDWLLTGTAPDRALLAARAAPEADEDVLVKAERRVRAIAEVEAALDKLEPDSVERPPLPAVSLLGRPMDDAESMADLVLGTVHDVGWQKILRTDPARVVERLFGINVVFEKCGAGLDGIALNSAASRVILVNTSIAWSRQRFTLAHEVGHLIAGDGRASGICVDADVMASQRVEEQRANSFAACLLMPRRDLRDDLPDADGVDDATFGRLVGEYRVSASAMAWRLKNLGYIDEVRRAQLGSMRPDQAARLGDWQAELGRLAVEQRRRRPAVALAERALVAFAEGVASARLVATILDVDPDEVLSVWHELAQPPPDVDGGREAVFAP